MSKLDLERNFANINQKHTYTLTNGYRVVLQGWTHTRLLGRP